MSTHGNEPFLFDLHEQISFRQGEEIDDLYGISIQPDVNVVKESSYIQLRGVLMVSGDYQSLPREEPMYYMDDQEDEENYVQQVKALDNGFTTFQYPIPVDITIPINRVNEMAEPDVEIDYFDYELPEPNTLHVYAKIRLAGVEMAVEEVEEVRSDDSNQDFTLSEIPSFEDESTRQETELDGAYENDQHEGGITETDPSSEKETGREFWNKKQSQSLGEFFDKKEEKQMKPKENVSANEQPKVEEAEEEKPAEKPAKKQKKVKKEKTKQKAEKEQVKQEAEEKQKPAKKKEATEENVKSEYKEQEQHKKPSKEKQAQDDDYEMNEEEAGKKKQKKGFGLSYLSNFFRDEEEPDRVRLKMRFVQENETLDSIAKSYQVSVTNLERINGFDSQIELQAGDVIYVPYEKHSS